MATGKTRNLGDKRLSINESIRRATNRAIIELYS